MKKCFKALFLHQQQLDATLPLHNLAEANSHQASLMVLLLEGHARLWVAWVSPSGLKVVDSLGDGLASLGREALLLFGDVGHCPGISVQGLFCVCQVLAQEGIVCTQPHVVELQRQEGNKVWIRFSFPRWLWSKLLPGDAAISA